MMLNIALPKGRLGEKAYEAFASAGYTCPGLIEENRKLIHISADAGIRFFLVKPSDVAIYVEHGAADAGVAGKDILLETEPDVYELIDLGIGKCRIAVAASKDYAENRGAVLRVATKYARVAQKHYASLNREAEIIKLNGSIELAPILGLSDVIVDIVESGSTLRENDLKEIETITQISARFIANRSSFIFKADALTMLADKLREVSAR
jgi:ATP phosphoribosyltransferase